MKKRVILIHGWGGAPDEGWRPWLKSKLEKDGFEVFNLSMPDTDKPIQESWAEHIKKCVGEPDEECYFIGHSLGSIAILRYLESLSQNTRVGGVILVAGFDDDLGVPELSNFFKTPINWEKIKSHATKFVSIESDNDPYELAKYNEIFKRELSAKTILAHNMKHFSGDDGISEAPVIYDELVSISS